MRSELTATCHLGGFADVTHVLIYAEKGEGRRKEDGKRGKRKG
jgi:hypothetical protein